MATDRSHVVGTTERKLTGEILDALHACHAYDIYDFGRIKHLRTARGKRLLALLSPLIVKARMLSFETPLIIAVHTYYTRLDEHIKGRYDQNGKEDQQAT